MALLKEFIELLLLMSLGDFMSEFLETLLLLLKLFMMLLLVVFFVSLKFKFFLYKYFLGAMFRFLLLFIEDEFIFVESMFLLLKKYLSSLS
jgi:hypothetical protein